MLCEPDILYMSAVVLALRYMSEVETEPPPPPPPGIRAIDPGSAIIRAGILQLVAKYKYVGN